MVGINPSNIKYQKLTFGAYDTTMDTPLAAIPAEISNDPYTENHGTKFKDHRKLLPTFEPGKKNLMPEYNDYYINANNPNQQQHPRKKGSMLKTFLVLGGLTGAGILVFKNRKGISNFFKKLNPFKKPAVNEAVVEVPKINIKSSINRISTSDFQKYYDDAMQKTLIEEKLDDIKPENIQVIMNNKVHSVAEKKKHLQNLFELGEMYNHKDIQPKVILIMKESIGDKEKYVIDMFAKNKIHKLDDKLIEKIEGFKLLARKRELSDKHDILVDSQVRHGVNSREPEDVGNKWFRNVRDYIRNLL